MVLDETQGWPEDALLHLYNRLREYGIREEQAVARSVYGESHRAP